MGLGEHGRVPRGGCGHGRTHGHCPVVGSAGWGGGVPVFGCAWTQSPVHGAGGQTPLFPSWFLTGEKGMDFAAVFPPGSDALHAQGCLFLTRLCPGGGGHPAAPRVRQSSPRSSVRGGTGRNPESRKCPKTRLFPLFPGCLLQNWNELPKKKKIPLLKQFTGF